MKKLIALFGALAFATVANASVQETWNLVGQAFGPGTTAATGNPNSNLFTGGYNLGRIDFSGTLLEINGTTNDFASENRMRVTLPNGAFTNVQFSTVTSYGPGALAISGSFYTIGGYNSNQSGTWNFRFFNTLDDGPVGLADAEGNITFSLTDELTAPATPGLTGNFNFVTDTQPVYANPDHQLTHLGGGIKWYRLQLNEHALANGKFLDIDTEGSLLADTEIALFDQFGTLIAQDDDDGSANLSQLSFGLTGPPRTIGTSVGGNGRDGELSIGTYYLAVGGFNSTFANGFSATTTSTNTTSLVNVNIRTSIVPEPMTLSLLGLGVAAWIRRRR